MVVDGSAVSREIATRILREAMEDADVTACGSGEVALQELSTGHFDLITTSLLLPDIDGLELCRKIRDSQEHHHTPIIVISGDADERLQREGFAAGVTDYFDKSQGYQAFGDFIKNFTQRNAGLVGKVLFVEDSRFAATLTLRMLEKHGLIVTHTVSAEEALRLIDERREEGADCFDLVITDFHLEEQMTGGDLLHTIRTRYRLSQQDLPVLIITGNDEDEDKVELFHAGANDFVNKPLIEEVFMARVRSLLLIKHQNEALKRQSQDIERVANTDALTGVFNRHYLVIQGTAWLASPHMRPLWAMVIDVDYLTRINNDNGLLNGDHVLAALGKLLMEHYQEGMVVRFGGEEFAVLLPGVEAVEAMARAEKVRRAVAQLKPDGIPVTISLGMAGSEEFPDADLNTLVSLADKALFAAKEAGRNRVCISHKDKITELTPRKAASTAPAAAATLADNLNF